MTLIDLTNGANKSTFIPTHILVNGTWEETNSDKQNYLELEEFTLGTNYIVKIADDIIAVQSYEIHEDIQNTTLVVLYKGFLNIV